MDGIGNLSDFNNPARSGRKAKWEETMKRPSSKRQRKKKKVSRFLVRYHANKNTGVGADSLYGN
jgi:hypothetical protein